MGHDMEVSVVVPVYRSRETLTTLVERLAVVLEGRAWEVILVDDGSPEPVWDVLESLHSRWPDRVIAVQLMRNFGQHNALMCGFRHCRGRLIVTMDDDLQNPPEEVPKLLAEIEGKNLDLVYGYYGEKRNEVAWRDAGSRLMRFFFRRVFGSSANTSSFRVLRRELLQATLSYNLNYTFIDGLLAWNTQRIGQVPVRHEARQHGRTGYSLSQLVVLSLNLLTNFSLWPLQAVSLLGLISAVGGILMGTYFLWLALWGGIAVPGFASIIIAILVMGGLQLLSLGMMGEYLGRIHLNINRKPQYTERWVLGPPAGSAGIDGLTPSERAAGQTTDERAG